jgi:hypothetical protein
VEICQEPSVDQCSVEPRLAKAVLFMCQQAATADRVQAPVRTKGVKSHVDCETEIGRTVA